MLYQAFDVLMRAVTVVVVVSVVALTCVAMGG